MGYLYAVPSLLSSDRNWHQFFFFSFLTTLCNHTQPLPTKDEDVPVLKNLQSKIRCNTGVTTEENEGYRSKVRQPLIWEMYGLSSTHPLWKREHGKGWLKDGGHSRVKEGLSPLSWAHSCHCIPWPIRQRHHQTRQLCHSSRISSIVTSQMACLVRSQWARPKVLII